MASTKVRMGVETERLNGFIDAINRYWLREYGCYPDAEDSMTIIGVISALDELHAQRCRAGAA